MKINYFQQGGQVDPVTAVIQSLIQNPQETYAKLEQLMLQGQQKQVNAILGEIKNRAVNGDPQAQAAIQALQQVMQGGQLQTQPTVQQAPVAKNGAKLNYFRKLKGLCPEGEEMVYLKKGGCMCQKKKDGGEAKAPKKQYFGKNKQVKKEEGGGTAENDSITATQKRSKSGNEVGTEKRDNGLTTIMAQGPALGGTYYGLFFKGDSIVGKTGTLNGAVYPVSEEERKRFINFVNGSDSIPVIYKERVPESSAMFPILSQKTGGKTQFFKKDKKAPLAKCGMKSKKKVVTKNQIGGPLRYASSFIDPNMKGPVYKEPIAANITLPEITITASKPFKRNFTVYGNEDEGFNNFTFSGDTPFGRVTNEFMHPIHLLDDGTYRWYDFNADDIGRYIMNGDTVYWSGNNRFGIGGNQDSLKNEFYKQLNDKGTTTLYKESDKKDLQRLRKESKKK